MSDIDLLGLRALKAVVDSGSINGAARQLRWSKSSLSRRVSALEAMLGQTLIKRRASGAELTAEGEVYFRYAEQILELSDQAKRALLAQSTQPTGQLTVRISRDFSRGWIGDAILAFVERNPGIKIDVVAAEYSEGIRAEQADLWIWVGPEPASNMRYERLATLHQRLYINRDYSDDCHIAQPKDVALLPWFLSPMDSDSLRLTRGGQEQLVSLAGARLRVDCLSSLVERVAFSSGVAVLPSFFAQCARHSYPGRLVNLLPDWAGPDLPLGLLTPFGPQKKAVTLLAEQLRRALPPHWQKA